MAAGARADFGFWFDDCETLGMGAKVWGLQGDSDGFYAASPDGNPVLARPFYNVVLDQEDALLAASPGLIVGSINADTTSSVVAAEAYLRSGMLAGRGYNLDLVGGYHFLRFDNDLSVFSNSMSIDPGGGTPVGTIIDVLDEFGAENEFHGGTIGVVGETRHGCWTLSGLAKFSVGNMRQTVDINGYQSITAPGDTPSVTPGGLLAQPTNMGEYARDVTAWIPEFGVTAGYDVRNWLRLTIGYNILWISNVAFAGDQIDRGVNPTQFGGNPLIGPARPAFTLPGKRVLVARPDARRDAHVLSAIRPRRTSRCEAYETHTTRPPEEAGSCRVFRSPAQSGLRPFTAGEHVVRIPSKISVVHFAGFAFGSVASSPSPRVKSQVRRRAIEVDHVLAGRAIAGQVILLVADRLGLALRR